ncbi:MAG: DegT/DnrJ/EryC1/StrS family aminotransferase [Alphaproteobacteria bacterium]
MRALDARNDARRRIAAVYDEQFADQASWLELPRTAEGREHVWHLYVVHLEDRAGLAAALRVANIGYGMRYPIALHRQAAFSEARIGASPAVCKNSAARLFSLPLFPEMSFDQIEALVHAVRACGGG